MHLLHGHNDRRSLPHRDIFLILVGVQGQDVASSLVVRGLDQSFLLLPDDELVVVPEVLVIHRGIVVA